MHNTGVLIVENDEEDQLLVRFFQRFSVTKKVESLLKQL